MTKQKLDIILRGHSNWLNDPKTGKRANLSDVDLVRADFIGARLSGANLSRADLFGANFKRATLAGVNLSDADLTKTQFCGANLCGANLSRADLSEADLSGANLCGANLSGANLSGANLSKTQFNKANLSEAITFGANISEAIKLYIPQACPEEGPFICYKKAGIYTNGYDYPDDYMIVKLLVPENAKRSSGTTRKCRCSEALVLDILNFDGTKANVDRVGSMHDSSFIYEIGKPVSVENFDENRWHECAPGIHFFMSIIEAINY